MEALPPEGHFAPYPSVATILFVEDETTIRGIAKLYLERQGYRVFEAGDGAEALHLWEKHGREIDLVLSDVVMPHGINGEQLIRRFQAERPELEVILVSGHSADAIGLDRETNFLQKPYRLQSLAEMIDDSLGHAKAA